MKQHKFYTSGGYLPPGMNGTYVGILYGANTYQNIRIYKMWKRIWNFILGLNPNDLNGDGKVDIKDKLIAAKRKAEYKPNSNHNG
jgi:hypothetical protein